MPAGTSNFGSPLLLGLEGTYEARSLFTVALWRLPDSSAGFTPVAVHFVLPQREILGVSGTVSADLWTTAGPWDASVTWPGPALDTALGSTVGYNFLGQFRVNLGPNGYSLMQQWKAAPLSAPSFEPFRRRRGP